MNYRIYLDNTFSKLVLSFLGFLQYHLIYEEYLHYICIYVHGLVDLVEFKRKEVRTAFHRA